MSDAAPKSAYDRAERDNAKAGHEAIFTGYWSKMLAAYGNGQTADEYNAARRKERLARSGK